MKGWCELVTFVGRGVRFRQNKKKKYERDNIYAHARYFGSLF